MLQWREILPRDKDVILNPGDALVFDVSRSSSKFQKKNLETIFFRKKFENCVQRQSHIKGLKHRVGTSSRLQAHNIKKMSLEEYIGNHEDEICKKYNLEYEALYTVPQEYKAEFEQTIVFNIF